MLLSPFILWGDKDLDMDGVPDSIDVCTHTPFLDVVNRQGCTTERLILPEDKDSNSLDIIMGYGIVQNEDILDRSNQYSSKIQVFYYNSDWIYSLNTGYFTNKFESKTEDSTLSIKRRFQLKKNLKLTAGAGVRLPSYNFQGNKTDYILSSTFNYYPTQKTSIYWGGSYTFVNDEETFSSLQNTKILYIGTGYFISKKLYGHFSYSNARSKFKSEHNIQSLSGTLFYQLNKKWFTSLSYQHEIDDEDLHNRINLKFGYSVW